MKVRTSNKLTFAVSVFLLAGSQANLVQAADDTYSSQAAPSGHNPSYQNYPPPPPGGWEGVIDSIDEQMKKENVALKQQGSTQSYTQQSGATRPQQPQAAQSYRATRATTASNCTGLWCTRLRCPTTLRWKARLWPWW